MQATITKTKAATVCSVITACFLASLLGGCEGKDREEPVRKNIPQAEDTSARWDKEKPFMMGVYWYDYAQTKPAEEAGMTYFDFFEKHLNILKENGANSLHYAVSFSRNDFDAVLALCDKYDFYLLPQLDFAYFNGNESDKTLREKAAKAGEFIRKYDGHKRILAWSVREEVPHEKINLLCRYYFMIKEHVPEADFFTLHSNLGAAADQAVPDPVIDGTDRYGFWWEFSGEGYMASPTSSLDWVRKESSQYYAQAAKRGADFWLVVTQGGFIGGSKNAGKWCDPTRSKEITWPKTEDAQKKLCERIRRFAKEGRMGWKEVKTADGTKYNYWKYYRLPRNCMKALAWTGVLEGARLFMCWSYSPPTKEKTATMFSDCPENNMTLYTLAGKPGQPNPQLAEFAEASREIKKYERIITRMSKLPESRVETDSKQRFYNRSFSFPRLHGNVIVVHNGNVGTWPGNNYMLTDDDDIRIDEEGNMIGYKPLTAAMDATLKVTELNPGDKIFDLATGKALSLDGENSCKVSVEPGSGKLLFLGTEKEFEAVKSLVR